MSFVSIIIISKSWIVEGKFRKDSFVNPFKLVKFKDVIDVGSFEKNSPLILVDPCNIRVDKVEGSEEIWLSSISQ